MTTPRDEDMTMDVRRTGDGPPLAHGPYNDDPNPPAREFDGTIRFEFGEFEDHQPGYAPALAILLAAGLLAFGASL